MLSSDTTFIPSELAANSNTGFSGSSHFRNKSDQEGHFHATEYLLPLPSEKEKIKNCNLQMTYKMNFHTILSSLVLKVIIKVTFWS